MAFVTERIFVAVCAALTMTAAAAGFPGKPLRILTPFSAGSVTDMVARPLAAKLADAWGQPVVVDNRGGAGGSIAAEIVAKAAPDGYTLLIGANGPNAVNPSLIKNMPYDSQRAFAAITLTATNNLLLAVPMSMPVKSVPELIALAREKPGQLRYGSPGTGSSPHLAGELFKSLAGVDMVHVPYKGSAPSVIALLGGEVNMIFSSIPAALTQIKSGRIKAIAVSTLKRSAALPDVPTLNEAGLTGYDAASWYGLFAPAGTPKNILATLSREVVKIMRVPEVRERFASDGFEPAGYAPAEFSRFLQAEIVKWAKAVKTADIKPE